MKYNVLSRGDEGSNRICLDVMERLRQEKLQRDEQQPDLVISIGGDGTLLEAFHRYVKRLQQTAFVGVHTGHLGFYADWRPKEIETLVRLIVDQPLETVDYPLLEVVIKNGREHTRYLALNEATVKTVEGSMVMDIEINGLHFETFRGDGLCISTPSGSTAYNKSLGGAIVHPSLSAFQLTEMASINNRVYRTIGSPLIFPEHHVCSLKPVHDRKFFVSVDHIALDEQDISEVQLRVAAERVKFARYQRFPFWKRVKESFVTDRE